MKPTEREKVVRVVQMDKHFLYLPFYYAQHKNFFGYLPSNYRVKKPAPPAVERTDEAAFKILMDSPDKKSDYELAICDPIQVLNPSLAYTDRRPAILAALVINSGFWAINRRTHKIYYFKDLGMYDRVIAYHPGSTSYSIAERIYKLSGKKESINDYIMSVNTGFELAELKKSEAATIALCPNPLAIDAFLASSEGYSIDLALGNTPEYSNALVTALISRADFVANHPNFIRQLLKALQLAMLLVTLFDEEVVNYANDSFSEGGEWARGALEKAIAAKVFPTSIEVSKVHWQNALRSGLAVSDEKKLAELAMSSFNEIISPYVPLVQDAVKSEIAPRLKPPTTTPHFTENYLKYSLIIFISLATGAVLKNFLPWIGVGLIGFSLVVSWSIDLHMKLSEHRTLRIIHWSIWTLIIFAWLLQFLASWELWTIVRVSAGLLTSDFALVYLVYNLQRKKNSE